MSAGKEPIIRRDDGALDQSIASKVAKIAYIQWYTDTQGGASRGG
jgi:hypothetical protein